MPWFIFKCFLVRLLASFEKICIAAKMPRFLLFIRFGFVTSNFGLSARGSSTLHCFYGLLDLLRLRIRFLALIAKRDFWVPQFGNRRIAICQPVLPASGICSFAGGGSSRRKRRSSAPRNWFRSAFGLSSLLFAMPCLDSSLEYRSWL